MNTIKAFVFQSSLELSPECNPHLGSRPVMGAGRFQSSLELSPECNEKGVGYSRRRSGFNPHSSFRPSATAASSADA